MAYPDAHTAEKRKRCSTCGEEKTTEEFHRDRTKPDGCTHSCRSCHNEAKRKWRAANPDKQRAYKNKRRKKERQYDAKRRREHAEKVRERIRNWQRQNPEKIRAYADANLEKIRARERKQHASNPEKYRELRRKTRAKSRRDLSNGYINRLLTHKHPFLRAADIPEELIEVKRQHIKLVRKLKEIDI